MKRFNRLVAIDKVVQRLGQDNERPSFQSVLAKALPQKLFGSVIAAQIDEFRIIGKTAQVRVPDPAWRAELNKSKSLLFKKTRGHFPDITALEIIA